MVVVIIFAVCWLPYHIYFIYTYHHKEVVTMPFIQHVYLVSFDLNIQGLFFSSKNFQTRPLFVYFRSFHMTNIAQIL